MADPTKITINQLAPAKIVLDVAPASEIRFNQILPSPIVVNPAPVTITGITLSPATTTTLGGVIVGDNLSINANGLLSAQATPYTLPVASNGTLGGVIVGTGLTIANEVLSTQYNYIASCLTASSPSSSWPSTPETFAINRHSLTTYNSIQYGANTPSYGRLIVRGLSSTNVVGGPYSTTANLPMFEIQLSANGNPYYNPNSGIPTFPQPITNAFRVRMVRGTNSGLSTVVEIVGAQLFEDYYDALYNLAATAVLTRNMGNLLYRSAMSTSAIYVAPINQNDGTSMGRLMCDERYMRISIGGPRP